MASPRSLTPSDSGADQYEPASSPSSSETNSDFAPLSSPPEEGGISPPSPPRNNGASTSSNADYKVTKSRQKKPPKAYGRGLSNIYTASSSRLTIEGKPLSPTHRKPAAADEILFRNFPKFKLPKEVEDFVEEEDVVKELPSSDLLKALHAYTSEFYHAKGWDEVGIRSMDEGALLALGVLIEEYCKEMVGKDGDLVFAEREEE